MSSIADRPDCVFRKCCHNSESPSVTVSSPSRDRDRDVASVESSSWTGEWLTDRRADRTKNRE
jgi:hypothetical protein